MLENARTGINQLITILGDLQNTSQASTQNLSTAMQTIGDRVLNVANMSAEQSTVLGTRMDWIIELLQRQILSETPQLRKAESEADEIIESSSEQETNKQILGPSNSCLEDALDRLSKLLKEKERTLFSPEAESIIEDMERILVYLLGAEEHYKAHDIRKKRIIFGEGHDGEDQDVKYQRAIKRTKRILGASDRVGLKEKGTYPALSPNFYLMKTSQQAHVMILPAKTKLRDHVLCTTSLAWYFYGQGPTRINVNANPHHAIISPSLDEGLESFDISVTYVPITPRKAQIAFTLSQRSFLESLSLQIPALSVSALLSNDSEVFQVIKNGDIDRLLKMISFKEASLHDRDTEGRSLLNVSLTSTAPSKKFQRK